MSTLLALDTCDRTVGVAVAMGGAVACWRVEDSPQRHSERLLALVDEALGGVGVNKNDLDAIAVTRGPGSFTGVRVGIATAKGLAFALGIPVLGVSSLAALWAGAAPFPGVVVPLLDARKGQVYATVRHGWEGGATLLAEGAWHPQQVLDALADTAQPCLFLGSGLGAYRDTFARALGERFWAAPATRWAIHPGEVAVAGAAALRRGEALSPEMLTPTYRRLSEAEQARGKTSSTNL